MYIIFILIGAVSGSLLSLVGTGAGLVIIPALVYFAHFNQKTAVGTSLAMLMFPVGIFAVATYYHHGYVNIRAAALLMLGFVVGSIIATRVAVNLPTAFLTRSFGVVAILIGLRMLLGVAH